MQTVWQVDRRADSQVCRQAGMAVKQDSRQMGRQADREVATNTNTLAINGWWSRVLQESLQFLTIKWKNASFRWQHLVNKTVNARPSQLLATWAVSNNKHFFWQFLPFCYLPTLAKSDILNVWIGRVQWAQNLSFSIKIIIANVKQYYTKLLFSRGQAQSFFYYYFIDTILH